jgi:hypothetical protein
MRVTGHPESRFLGYVRVQVASRSYDLPVRAASLSRKDGGTLEPGFFADDAEGFSILVDAEASDADQRAVIERASAEAARHISRKTLN